MFRIQDIKNGEDYIVAFKVIEKQYIDNIVNQGQFYFSLIEDYRKMEGEGNQEIGDRYEASLTTRISEYIKIGGNYEEIHGPNAGNNIRINANQCAFCFYMIGLNSYDNEADNKYRFCIPYSELKNICKDKGGIENCAIIIFDRNTIKKIYSGLKAKGFFFKGSEVVYDDFNYIPENPDVNSWQYALECCFHKRKKHAYQNEFRIVALNDKKEPISDLFIEVGENEIQVIDLKDYCNFCSYIEVTASEVSNNITGVYFSIGHSLEPV